MSNTQDIPVWENWLIGRTKGTGNEKETSDVLNGNNDMCNMEYIAYRLNADRKFEQVFILTKYWTKKLFSANEPCVPILYDEHFEMKCQYERTLQWLERQQDDRGNRQADRFKHMKMIDECTHEKRKKDGIIESEGVL